MVNVSMYILHEVTPYATWDTRYSFIILLEKNIKLFILAPILSTVCAPLPISSHLRTWARAEKMAPTWAGVDAGGRRAVVRVGSRGLNVEEIRGPGEGAL